MNIPENTSARKAANKKPRSRRRTEDHENKVVEVRIRLRAQQQPAAAGKLIRNKRATQAMHRVLDADVSGLAFPIVKIEAGDITFVDLDTHHLSDKPSDQQLDAWAESIRPEPNCWWRTHGSGLRLVYCGPHHEECAVAAALSAPKLFGVEIKTDTRHPAGDHPDYPGKTAGPVQWVNNIACAAPGWRAVGRTDDRAVDELLAEMGMQRGGRYDHELCPIGGGEASDAKDCVVVLDCGIWCHRCAGKGICFHGCSRPGFVPFAALSGSTVTRAVIYHLAEHLVHWAHAQVHLREEYPNLGDTVLRKAYACALSAKHGADDPRVSMVFNPDLRLVQGEHAWFELTTHRDIRVTESTLTSLPAILSYRKLKKDGEPECTVRGPLLDLAKSGIPLDGYKPVRFVRGVALHEDERCLQLANSPLGGEPVKLLSGKELLTQDKAFHALKLAFPGLDQNYLLACLAAAICADKGGRPPITVAIGPTGSGKGETLRLAASFLADDRQTLSISGNEQENWRQIGTAIEGGHRFLAFDEYLRRKGAIDVMVAVLLQVSAEITWRRLYSSGNIQTRNRAAYFLAAGCVPDSFKKSPEIRRRMWLIRLPRSVPEWRNTCGGDTVQWRSRSRLNAQIGNSLLTHAHALCAGHSFDFDRVAAALGLTRLDEGEAEVQREVLQDLYRHCRDEYGDRVLHKAKRYVQGEWVDALSAPCQELLQQLLPDEDTDRPDAAGMIFQLQQNLQMHPWDRVLGIPNPPIRCEMRRHGAHVVIRFVEAGALRGRERINEQLPPIPGGGPPAGGDCSDGGAGGSDRDGGPRIDGREGPTDKTSDDSLCQLRQQPWQNGDPPDGVENADIGPREPRSASSASYASLSEKGGAGELANSNEEDSSPKSLAELTERTDHPAIAANADSTAGITPDTTLDRTAGATCRTTGCSVDVPDLITRAGTAPNSTPTPAPNPAVGTKVGAVLSSAGFPPELLTLDFETYFDQSYSLRKTPIIPEYVLDPRFHAHGVAIRRPDGSCEFATNVDAAIVELRREFGERLEAVTVLAHHAHFDMFILAKRYRLSPAYMTDSLAMARHVFPRADNRLADLAKRFELQPKGDVLDQLDGVRELSPSQLAKLTAYAKHDAELCFDVACRLLARLSRPEIELRLIDHNVRLLTERALPFDLDGARQLVQDVSAELQAVLDAAGVDRRTAGGNELEKLLSAELAKSGRKVPTKSGKKGPIAALAKGDEGMKLLLTDPNPQVQKLAQARLAVKSAPQLEKRLNTMIRVAEATGGVLPVALKYCGAHTGRYSGDEGVNLQNLPAHVEGLASRMRGLLHAGDGHQLVVVDAAQIEARVLAWFAGEQELLGEFAQDGDPYSRFASGIFDEPVRKPNADDPDDVKQRLAPRRQLGKVCVLGLGYQAGVERFKDMVRSDPKVAQLSGVLTDAFLESVHREYRRRHPKIVASWHDAQQAFEVTLKTGSGVVRGIRMSRDSGAAYIHLPSSRKLYYLDPEINPLSEMLYTGGKIYGGLLVQNIVQAIARDILAEAILALEDRGYPVVLTVHDEIVLHVTADRAEQALTAAIACLSTTPAWADGLPLAAEGRIANRYGK